MHFSTDPDNPAIWMQVTAARLGFIIVFEHFVFFITGLVDFMIPDIPAHVQTAIEREKYLGKEALRARAASPLPEQRSQSGGRSQLTSLPEELLTEPLNAPTSTLSFSEPAPNAPPDSRLTSNSDSFHQINSLPSHLPSYHPSQADLQPTRASSVTSRPKHVTPPARASVQSDYQNIDLSSDTAFVMESESTFNRTPSVNRTSKENFELSDLSRTSGTGSNIV